MIARRPAVPIVVDVEFDPIAIRILVLQGGLRPNRRCTERLMHAILSRKRRHPIMTTAERKGDRFLEVLATA
jgi:hypothetical protein